MSKAKDLSELGGVIVTDASGNVLVGKTTTSDATTTVGFHVQPSGVAVLTRDGGAPLRVSRKTSDGEVISVHKDGTTVGVIGTQNWGIGTNLPVKTLHIEETSPAIRISNTVDGGWSTGDVIGEIGFWATDGSGREAGYIKSVQETNGGSVTDGALVFGTTTYGNTTSVERMRIDTGGTIKLITANDTAGTYKNITFGTNAFNRAEIRVTNAATYDGSLEFYTGNASNYDERMRIDSNGSLLVGTTTPGISNSISTTIEASGLNNSRIYVNHSSTGSSNNSLYMGFGYGGNTIGSIRQNSTTSVSYLTTSDYRLKENAVAMTGAITRVKSLQPKRFNFIADKSTTVDGFMAHEVATVVPEAIGGEKDAMIEEEYEVTPAVLDEDGNVVTEAVMGTRSVPDYQGIDQSKLVPLLTAALQEAIAKIEDLEARVATLETN